MLPTFLIIGAQKAGTTTLWAHLAQHPDVFMPAMKEPNFFLGGEGWDKGVGWYEDLFEPGRGKPVRGEASTGYTMWPIYPGVPERIASVSPEVKLVYLVREPVDRMISSWRHLMADHIEYKVLDESMRTDFRYLSMSLYATQIERYLEHFDREQILVQRSEDLQADPQAVLARVCRFIGADDSWTFPNLDTRLNPSDVKRIPRWGTRKIIRGLSLVHADRLATAVKDFGRQPLYRPFATPERSVSDETRRHLYEYLRPDLQRLAALCGPEFRVWTPPGRPLEPEAVRSESVEAGPAAAEAG